MVLTSGGTRAIFALRALALAAGSGRPIERLQHRLAGLPRAERTAEIPGRLPAGCRTHDGSLDPLGRRRLAEVAEHHGPGEDCPDRVGHALACVLWRRAVNRLEEPAPGVRIDVP